MSAGKLLSSVGIWLGICAGGALVSITIATMIQSVYGALSSGQIAYGIVLMLVFLMLISIFLLWAGMIAEQ